MNRVRLAVVASLAGIAAACGGTSLPFGAAAPERPVVATPLPEWGEGACAATMGAPAGVAALPGGGAAAVDAARCEVVLLDAACREVRRLGGAGAGPGRFTLPDGIAADSAGRTYVVDALADGVALFASDGTLVASWGRPGGAADALLSPRGVAVMPSGDVVVADEKNHRLQIFAPDGTHRGALGAVGGGRDLRRPAEEGGGPVPGAWPRPRAVATSANGGIAVAAANGVHRVGADGRPAAAWNLPLRDGGETATPTAVAFLVDDRILVGDDAGRLLLFDLDGGLIASDTRLGSSPGEKRRIAGIAATEDGTWWISDPADGRVIRMRSNI